MEELTDIVSAQTKELAAKEAIITYLKQKVKSLQQTLAERKHCTCAPEPVDLENVPLQTSNRCNGIDATVIMVPGMMGETNVDATARKRKADDVELQTPQCKVAKTTSQSFLKAASDEMKSCIKWGGALSVEFKTDVEPSVFAKVFDGCKRGRSNRPLYTQEPGELPRRCDTETVYLDRDDMLRIFGKSRAGRKFRYSGQATIESLTVTYNELSKVAHGTGSWAFSQNAD